MDFEFPYNKAFCHPNEDYFLAGGWRNNDYKYLNNLWRITLQAEILELSPMPISNSAFPMTYYGKKNSLITIGGFIDKK